MQTIRPVPFTRVTLQDSFWAPRQHTNRDVTLPLMYDRLKETGRLDALRLDWKPGKEPVPHIFWESDVAKWLEAASYSLAVHYDPQLDALLDEVIALIALAQQSDGYLNVYFTVVKPQYRWLDLRDAHELYCAGHLMEAAVAHHAATGKRTLLEVLCRYADHIATVFGPEPGQKRGYCGHPEVELALVRLYRATGEERYLKLSQFFVDERGRLPLYFHGEQAARGGAPSYFSNPLSPSDRGYDPAYCQSHKPVREQTEVTGHAVRAMYLYSAMADLAGETGDGSLLGACRALWDHLTGRLMYVTGGIGSTEKNEGFTTDFDLPNAHAYCETCASIGLVFWAHRMLHLTGEGKYADVLERALYNNVVSGVSLDGRRFFYDNPLASSGSHHRRDWFSCACCPPNVARLLASLGQYVYSESAGGAAIHLYIQGSGTVDVASYTVKLHQSTQYPWDGHVRIRVEPQQPASFTLSLRVPGWCRAATLSVCGQAVPVEVQNGYARVDRLWHPDDLVELSLEMPVERVYADPRVEANLGCVALQRGPLVLCAEAADCGPGLAALALPRDVQLQAAYEPDLLGGVVSVTGRALRPVVPSTGGGSLYGTEPWTTEPVTFKAVPYAVWDNRLAGAMRVWLREA